MPLFYTYDSNGYLDVVVDWEGNAIDYDHDSAGREERREEGLSATINSLPPHTNLSISTSSVTGVTRVIETKWHPDFRLPTRTTEPDFVEDITYDCDTGRVTQRIKYAPGTEPNPYVEPTCP